MDICDICKKEADNEHDFIIDNKEYGYVLCNTHNTKSVHAIIQSKLFEYNQFQLAVLGNLEYQYEKTWDNVKKEVKRL